MTKNILLHFIMLLAVFMTTACNKDNIATSSADEIEVPVRITANLSGLAPDSRNSYEVPTLKNMRVTLIVASEGKVLSHETKNGQSFADSNLSFSTKLIAGEVYDIALWADFGEEYYTLNIDKNASSASVSMKTDRTGNSNLNDAFWGVKNGVIIETNESIDITLKRPLAIVCIKNTGNENISGKLPRSYSTSVNSYTTMNLLNGVLNDATDNISITGTIDNVSDGDLSFDYFFAGEEEQKLNSFVINYTYNDNSTTSYQFTGIPVKRNCMTKVSGSILQQQ